MGTFGKSDRFRTTKNGTSHCGPHLTSTHCKCNPPLVGRRHRPACPAANYTAVYFRFVYLHKYTNAKRLSWTIKYMLCISLHSPQYLPLIRNQILSRVNTSCLRFARKGSFAVEEMKPQTYINSNIKSQGSNPNTTFSQVPGN